MENTPKKSPESGSTVLLPVSEALVVQLDGPTPNTLLLKLHIEMTAKYSAATIWTTKH
jgi:hypothetical protein